MLRSRTSNGKPWAGLTQRRRPAWTGDALRKERLQDVGQHLRQVLGDQSTSEFLRGFAMQPHGRARRLEGRHVLCEKARDQPREHVARSGGCKPRRRVGIDCGAAARMRDDGVGPLQDHDGAARACGGAGAGELVAFDAGEQAAELAFVRREHDGRAAGGDRAEEMRGAGVQV